MFTGDRSGEHTGPYCAGFASRPTSVSRHSLLLIDAWVTSAVNCAPPGNRPTTEERDNCRSWLDQELDALDRLRVVVCLGAFAWAAAHTLFSDRGVAVPRPRPRFAHLAVSETSGPTLIGSYHPSQQNTFTGRLTEGMLAGSSPPPKVLVDEGEQLAIGIGNRRRATRPRGEGRNELHLGYAPGANTIRLPRPLDPVLPLDPTTQRRVTGGLTGSARQRADHGAAAFAALPMPVEKDEGWRYVDLALDLAGFGIAEAPGAAMPSSDLEGAVAGITGGGERRQPHRGAAGKGSR
jgi:uracil-DNA glycosylase